MLYKCKSVELDDPEFIACEGCDRKGVSRERISTQHPGPFINIVLNELQKPEKDQNKQGSFLTVYDMCVSFLGKRLGLLGLIIK